VRSYLISLNGCGRSGTAVLDGVGTAGVKGTTGGRVHRIGTVSLDLDRARRDSIQLDFGPEPVCST
jgi:hypothetical protein